MNELLAVSVLLAAGGAAAWFSGADKLVGVASTAAPDVALSSPASASSSSAACSL